MEKERKLILDTETTGLDYNDDKIIEIGIVELNENVLTRNFFHEYINPEKDITVSAQKIHGISNEFLIDKPTFNDIASKFMEFIKNDPLIIHNAEFDLNFINKELQNCGYENLKNPIIDTIKLAKKEFPGQAVNLDSLCRKLNVVNTRQDHHGALLDADLLSKVYLKLTTGKQENLNLVNSKLNNSDNGKDSMQFKKKLSLPRDQLMRLSNYEKIQHENFITEMSNPIWNKIR